MSDCVVTLRIGPTVVTRVTALPPRMEGDPITRIPFPEGAWFTISSLCTVLGITRNHLYVLLTRNAERFTSPALYRPRRRGRRGGPARLERILSMNDYNVLRELLPVRVKFFHPERKRKDPKTP